MLSKRLSPGLSPRAKRPSDEPQVEKLVATLPSNYVPSTTAAERAESEAACRKAPYGVELFDLQKRVVAALDGATPRTQ